MEENHRSLVLAAYIFKATALIGIQRGIRSNVFRYQMTCLAVLIDYKILRFYSDKNHLIRINPFDYEICNTNHISIPMGAKDSLLNLSEFLDKDNCPFKIFIKIC